MLVHPSQRAASVNCRENAALVYLLDDERHGKNHRRPDSLYRFQEQCGYRRLLEVVDRRSAEHRIKQTDSHFKSMGQRKEGEPYVIAALLAGMQAGNDIRRQVAVAEYHALGAAGGA